MRRTARSIGPLVMLALVLPAAPLATPSRLGPADPTVQHLVATVTAPVVRTGVGGVHPGNTRRDWTYLIKGIHGQGPKPLIWRRCRITWAYHPGGGYPGAARHLREAFRRVQRHTTLRFVRRAYRTHRNVGADVGIRWRGPKADPGLAGPVLGYARPRFNDKEIVDARIVLDRTARTVRRGFHGRDGRTWGTVMVHEIGHVLGLGRARAPTAHVPLGEQQQRALGCR